ncbi:hypothetical protein ACHAXT_011253 [Thalassiosira profunda]
MSSSSVTQEFCDGDALPAEETDVTSLARDQFHKICPGAHRDADGAFAPLGQPRCGDGSNFSFLLHRPKEPQPRDKIAIELSGGGACWDSLTCSLQGVWLTYPVIYNFAVGKSCSEYPSFLCAKTVGGVDFTEFTSISIPYCTQDVHLGDEPNATYGETTVRHVGAHNIHRTLQWLFANFPNPSDIFITGCSAGGTPLPVVYDLINSHYRNTLGEQRVNIDVVSDSPVFLTPSHFLLNYFPNWNVRTMTEKIGFDFESYQFDTQFPQRILDHALERSTSTDSIGMVTHDADQVSLGYYSLMNGGSVESLFGGSDEALQTQWWAELNSSMTNAMEEHSNFMAFVIDGEAHCTFGLNVPLGYDGFEDWLTSVFEEDSNVTLPSIGSNDTLSTLPPADVSDAVVPTPPVPKSNAGAPQASPGFAIATAALLTLMFLAVRRQ